MPVMPMAVRSPIVKGKVGYNRPSPPSVIISRGWWRGGVISYHRRRRITDFFDRFLDQLSILPNPLPHFLAIGIRRLLRNGFNGMSALIIINHRFAILGCISGCLIILISRIADQSPEYGSCSQSD
jgi:hypothetical protein